MVRADKEHRTAQKISRQATGHFLWCFPAQPVWRAPREPRLPKARLSKTETGASSPEERGLRPE